jgi:hypothetical protein
VTSGFYPKYPCNELLPQKIRENFAEKGHVLMQTSAEVCKSQKKKSFKSNVEIYKLVLKVQLQNLAELEKNAENAFMLKKFDVDTADNMLRKK